MSILLVGSSCASSPQTSNLREWQLWDVKTGRPTTFEELKPTLMATDVIYVGEEHYTPSHIQAALRVLEALLAEGRQPALALEMFSWDGQSALDRYVLSEIVTEEQFLQESHWSDNWGGDYEDYQPLVTFQRKHQLPMLALNPPRPLVRQVATKGLAEARLEPAMAAWGMDGENSLDDPAYRSIIFEQIEKCHPDLPAHVYERIYEASLFRDEGMARVVTDYLHNRTKQPSSLVSYTGGGHIQYGVPVPKRVQRRSASPVRQVTLYLHGYDPDREEEIHKMMQDGIADYVWLTPLGPRGSQPRC